jgi:hypothetical protein
MLPLNLTSIFGIYSRLSAAILVTSIIIEGNSHVPTPFVAPISNNTPASNCYNYAAITAMSAAALTVATNQLVSFGPPRQSSALLRVRSSRSFIKRLVLLMRSLLYRMPGIVLKHELAWFKKLTSRMSTILNNFCFYGVATLKLSTDSRMAAVGDVVLSGNTPVARPSTHGEWFDGWWPLVQLDDSSRSTPPIPAAAGGWYDEMPYYSIHSPEVPQRNYCLHCTRAGADNHGVDHATQQPAWSPIADVAFPTGIQLTPVQRNGRFTIGWSKQAGGVVGAVVMSVDIANYPELGGKAVYFAMEAAVPVYVNIMLWVSMRCVCNMHVAVDDIRQIDQSCL